MHLRPLLIVLIVFAYSLVLLSCLVALPKSLVVEGKINASLYINRIRRHPAGLEQLVLNHSSIIVACLIANLTSPLNSEY